MELEQKFSSLAKYCTTILLYLRYFIYFCIIYICKIHSTCLDLKIAYKYINVCNRLIKLLPTIFKDAFPTEEAIQE